MKRHLAKAGISVLKVKKIFYENIMGNLPNENCGNGRSMENEGSFR